MRISDCSSDVCSSDLVELGLRALGELAAEQLIGQFHHFVLPAFAHGLLSFFPVAGASFFGRRPALRSDSRSTYSIWALRLRNSSSAQRCAAASTSALIRSGYSSEVRRVGKEWVSPVRSPWGPLQ